MSEAGRPLTVGFTLIGRGNWSGGETYLRNMLGVIAAELEGRVRSKLFLTPDQAAKLGGSLDPFLAAPPVVDPAVARFGRGSNALKAAFGGSDAEAAGIFAREGVDVVFEPAQFYGRNFPRGVVSWMPDFQHRHLPHLFSRRAWWRRDIGFRLQTTGRRTIMLSSEDARRDCERFYPASRGRTAVVRFAVDLDPAVPLARRDEIRGRYGLPDRFFYLPNQFWTHKNHAVVVRALALIAKQGRLGEALPVILTGRTEDPRNPAHFSQLMASARAAGVLSHFRHLGLVPYEDVFGLNAAATALINPSLFEGWSTTVEEAKALGTPLLLSDISLHREQAPDAAFFLPDEPELLAQTMLDLSERDEQLVAARLNVATLRATHQMRRHSYANALYATFKNAIDRGDGSDGAR